MRTVEEHQAVVAALLRPLSVEEVPVAVAAGRVLAADVPALVALPGFDNSAMDGYAARAAEVGTASEQAPVRLPVAADIPAGRTDVPVLEPGTVHRIMTGAPVPAGADVIVPVERTDGATDVVTITGAPAAGTHLRHAGEDIAAGALALPAGTALGPAQLGLAAAVGHAMLPVRRRPRVLVLSTGSELVEPGRPLAPGQIYESNSVLLAAAVADAGGEPRTLHFVPDDVDQFLATVRAELAGRAGEKPDLLVTSGGVSAGAYEVVKDAFGALGTVEFVKVAMQPGGPQGAGTVDGVPVVTLPGNPVSSFVSFEVFVRPALRRALGHAAPDRLRTSARLSEPLRSPAGRRQFLRGRFDGGVVTQVGGPGSHLVAHLARANCLVVVPEEVTELPAGAEVAVVLIEGALQ
ncbi:molybdopterin molybdochelatase [Modestobacter sp. DSM 44400]|uniref:molybdopterin molybdotransferase MoeA n=1 Tax=Modestobacter sp. DSM 44400 TaxID=1550230 RepID=UPI00089765B1|nr:gephyrin-like molybdotransferase Glp [Modestobacter sp. DSM 44400]SDX51911.1 molybdopterin molybdochelatase [Modestobacter sp. DSM 44400]